MANITLTIDQNSGKPLYMQLYDHIRNEIREGLLEDGARLPSKRSLASHLRISQNTVETAYGQLLAEGFIRSKPKSGYYVSRFEVYPSDTTGPESTGKEEETREDTSGFAYDFMTNTVDTRFFPFSTWSRITREVIHDENRELLKASHPQGEVSLRMSIARHLHEHKGVRCTHEQVIIGAGSEYLIGLLVQLLGRDRVYAVEDPGYVKTGMLLMSNGSDVVHVGLDRDGLDVKELEESGAKIVHITPSHQFPMGMIMPARRRMQLLAWAYAEKDRYIIEDDYDSEFRFGGRPIPSLQGLDNSERVIYIGTFSKSLAPSIRIGYLVLPPSLIEEYRKRYMYNASTVSRFEQQTLARFIKDGHFERHLNRMRKVYKSRKENLVNEIRRASFGKSAEIIGENAGLHLLLSPGNGMSEMQLLESAASAGVRLRGLSGYFSQDSLSKPQGTVLLGYSSLSEEEISEAVSLLDFAWS
ncbi:PLP-dependent aminotransferase family protein [Youngiibacter fragilis]|uniref:GntR family transcriptional regulator n=1 Tax=Youngiibacter fragilis 232.1 TaxID=994573 RepID=V7IC02_9CLOT|nr:PLP-dependent aminotransferase family protein [Youngiibacter fragilis]ETA82402.1 GntR family transcriptional regulator [Youngiibacter fragilis 232.1]